MRTFVIGDVHGCINELKKLYEILITEENMDLSKDRLIFLGDYIDRGIDSRKVVRFIRNLQKENDNVIALMGNHEDMLIKFYSDLCSSDCDWLINSNETRISLNCGCGWLCNGYEATISSYAGHDEDFVSDVEWMKTLPLYFEDEHFIYVHAGIDTSISMNEQTRDTLLWIRQTFIFDPAAYEKKVVFGHTPADLVGMGYHPYHTNAGNIGIDTGCFFSGRLTALVIEDDVVLKYYQNTCSIKEINILEEKDIA